MRGEPAVLAILLMVQKVVYNILIFTLQEQLALSEQIWGKPERVLTSIEHRYVLAAIEKCHHGSYVIVQALEDSVYFHAFVSSSHQHKNTSGHRARCVLGPPILGHQHRRSVQGIQ